MVSVKSTKAINSPHAEREDYYKENAMRYGYLAGLVIFVVTAPLGQAPGTEEFFPL